MISGLVASLLVTQIPALAPYINEVIGVILVLVIALTTQITGEDMAEKINLSRLEFGTLEELPAQDEQIRRIVEAVVEELFSKETQG